ncbi:MAG: hypothetical protein VXZ84_03700 [Planctomycetota bacterium]|nr:hypothetical protein [Planctomycetota bacterium]
MIRNSIIFLLVLLSGWQVKAIFACRYTVRDVAFVDLGDAPYRLFVLADPADEETSGGLQAAVDRIAEQVLLDANTVIEFVDTSPEIDHPALKYATEVKQFPALIAVGPEQEPLTIKQGLGQDASTAEEELNLLCREFVDSSARREMFSKLLGVHSVILMVEGTDEQVNQDTREMIAQTLPQVEQSLEFLPKPIKEPPHVIRLTAEEAADEKILLWALGMDPEATPETRVALLFGRGRKLGPILRFPEDPRRRFIQSLAVVGQDCECGLDRRWMQGAMVPHRWSSNEEKMAIKQLGFDPGNPLVKAEIDRILTRGPGTDGGREVELEDALKIAPALSYQEIAIDDLVTDAATDTSATDTSETVAADELVATESTVASVQENEIAEFILPEPAESPAAASAGQTAAQSQTSDVPPDFAPPRNWSYLFLIGSALVVVTIGLFILLRDGEGAA